MAKRDYYEVLGVNRESSDAELKNAFRSLARKNHPDKNPDDPDAESRFKEIQEAYAVLSNAEQRRRYDMFGHDAPGGSPFGPGGFEGVNISFDDLFSGGGFESVFSQFFGGGGGGGHRSSRGNDILIRHSISMEMAMLGGETELEANLLVPCEACDGSAAATPEGVKTCGKCGGQGQVAQNRKIGPFIQQIVSDCPDCRGTGRKITDPCKPCRGDGRQKKKQTIRFTIPAGISDETRMRMGGRGEPRHGGGGRPGDLYIQVNIDSHEWYERDGSDLLMALPVGYPELLLGTTVMLPHVDGKELEIVVPSGSSPGETIELRGRGFPRPRGRGRGDVTVLLKLHVPDKLSKQTKKQIEELRGEIGVDVDAIEDLVRKEAKSRRRSR
ncbi:MAG: J domain-containing protein [Candidatus Thalassarchaeaceae archaeon]|jgi:molecular chaperone DnaJ|nr:J domain-containing protein [Candidatus Thalassarchaeaceae archaeon]